MLRESLGLEYSGFEAKKKMPLKQEEEKHLDKVKKVKKAKQKIEESGRAPQWAYHSPGSSGSRGSAMPSNSDLILP